MNKKVFALALIFLGNFVPSHSATINNPCEVAGIGVGTLAGVLHFAKEYRRTIQGTTKLDGFDGMYVALFNTLVSPVFLELGRITARLSDSFIKDATDTIQSTRSSSSEKMGNTILNVAGTCCVLPISLALYAIGGKLLGEGVGHIGGVVTLPAGEVLHDIFNLD